ncbi:hypothetical protein D3C77_703040 [compost metagenome]
MLLQTGHKRIDIANERLRLAQLLKLLVVCLVSDIARVIFNVNNHGIQFGAIQ